MLKATDLACVRGDRHLFANVGFSLEPGGRLHVTGENGSGKTSLLRILCGLSPPEAGEIHWQGTPIRSLGDEYRKAVLYLGHHNAIKEELTALENLRTTAALAGIAVTEEEGIGVLERVGLAGREHLPVRVLSQGQKRRVALSRLLWTPAPLWILDEPFVALDVAAVAGLAEIVGEHLDRGGMAILTSHQEVNIASGVEQFLRIAS